MSRNTDSTVLFSKENISADAVRKRARGLVSFLLDRLLPPSIIECKPMRSLVMEIVTSYVIWPLLEYLSNPATLDDWMLQALASFSALKTEAKTSKQSEQQHVRDGSIDDEEWDDVGERVSDV